MPDDPAPPSGGPEVTGEESLAPEGRRTPSADHEAILDRVEAVVAKLHQQFALWPTGHRLVRPTKPLLGIYKPDFIWYVGQEVDDIGLIGEVEESQTASKAVLGACILADLLAKRMPCAGDVPLAFIVPDKSSVSFRGHLEERLNLASAYTKHVRVIPAMCAEEFERWFAGFAVNEINRRRDDGDEDLGCEDEDEMPC